MGRGQNADNTASVASPALRGFNGVLFPQETAKFAWTSHAATSTPNHTGLCLRSYSSDAQVTAHSPAA
jgi:hypothetical protein